MPGWKDPERAREYKRQWVAANPDKVREYSKRYRLGLTVPRPRMSPEERLARQRAKKREQKAATPTWRKRAWRWRHYGIELTNQEAEYWSGRLDEGACELENEDCAGDLGLDHDHKTKRPRGILCSKHNLLLEWTERNANAVKAYLGG